MSKSGYIRVVMGFVTALVVSFFWLGLWGFVMFMVFYPLLILRGRKHV